MNSAEAPLHHLSHSEFADNTSADSTSSEREIDQRVYKLYGLTEEEIAIVEGPTRRVEGARK